MQSVHNVEDDDNPRPRSGEPARRRNDRSMKVPAYELKRYATIVENDEFLRQETGVVKCL